MVLNCCFQVYDIGIDLWKGYIDIGTVFKWSLDAHLPGVL